MKNLFLDHLNEYAKFPPRTCTFGKFIFIKSSRWLKDHGDGDIHDENKCLINLERSRGLLLIQSPLFRWKGNASVVLMNNAAITAGIVARGASRV